MTAEICSILELRHDKHRKAIMETLEQFSERMSQVEKESEFQVGAWHRGHSRAIFVFAGQYCYLESSGYVMVPPHIATKKHPLALLKLCLQDTVDTWWADFEVKGYTLAQRIAEYYSATIEETFYGEPDNWHFRFPEHIDKHTGIESDDGWERLMKFVYDRHTGEFFKMFGCGAPPPVKDTPQPMEVLV